MTNEELISKIKLLENNIRSMKSEVSRYNHENSI